MSSFESEISTKDAVEIISEDGNRPLAEAISFILMKLIQKNKQLKNYRKVVKKQAKMSFSAVGKPGISLYDYLMRMMFYCKANDSTFINSLIYIDRICTANSILITEYNIHRFLVSVKFNEDKFYEYDYYARIAGISKNELLWIEREFLDVIDFKLFIKDKDYMIYYESLKTVNKTHEEDELIE